MAVATTRWLEIRRHSLTKKGPARGRGSHLSAQGVALARAVGPELGPAAYVLTSAAPRVATVDDGAVALVVSYGGSIEPALLTAAVSSGVEGPADPNGLETFYLMLATTIVGFITVFQVRANAAGLPLPQWAVFIVALAVASFSSLIAVLIGPWAILPTWLFFVVLGNSSSGGAVAPPLLPPPFAFVSQWLPSGATVTALREAAGTA